MSDSMCGVYTNLAEIRRTVFVKWHRMCKKLNCDILLKNVYSYSLCAILLTL